MNGIFSNKRVKLHPQNHKGKPGEPGGKFKSNGNPACDFLNPPLVEMKDASVVFTWEKRDNERMPIVLRLHQTSLLTSRGSTH